MYNDQFTPSRLEAYTVEPQFNDNYAIRSSKMISLNWEYCYTGVLPHRFYCNTGRLVLKNCFFVWASTLNIGLINKG